MHSNSLLIVCLCIVGVAIASPKKYTAENGGFQPSSMRYFETPLENTTAASKQERASHHHNKEDDRLQRFGVTAYGTAQGGQYGNYGMAPMKIDIGGIALGALIGLGAILIVPKLAHVFSTGGYGYRSLENDMSSITDILAKVDNSLEQHNIDSSSCMQRIICSYVHEAQKNMESGSANTVEQVVYGIANNSLFSYLLDGSSVKQAIDMGKQSDLEKCAALYMKCPVSKENVMQIISNLLPA